jgi:hypothetical protein
MSALTDTNILTRSAQPQHPMHHAAVESVAVLHRQGERLYVAPQNLYEFGSFARARSVRTVWA